MRPVDPTMYIPLRPPGRCRRMRGMPRRVALVLCGLAAFTIVVGTVMMGVASSDGQDIVIESSPSQLLLNNDALRIIIIGDTGGIPVFHTTRSQKKTAKQMVAVARREGLDAVINMGDNVYFTGVEHEKDQRFRTSFEKPYGARELSVPWYMMAGNHDHFGNVTAQVEYTKYSTKWKFPSLYYNQSFSAPDGATVDLVVIDTIVLCGNSKDIEYAGFWKMLWTTSHEPKGPENVTTAEIQWNWLEQKLNNSRASYLLVAGHYPIHSVSSHGPTKCVADRLDPLLKKYNATAYLSGHDHTLQHISYPNGDDRVHYIVSGAGSRADPSTKHGETIEHPGILHHHFPKTGTIMNQLGVSDGGFAYAKITSSGLAMRFIDEDGNEVYSTTIGPRKSNSQTRKPTTIEEILVPTSTDSALAAAA